MKSKTAEWRICETCYGVSAPSSFAESAIEVPNAALEAAALY